MQAGQTHQFKVRLKALQGNANPEGFDRQKWRYSQHIAYIASVKEHISAIKPNQSLRATLYNKVISLTDSMTHQGSIIALIFADKSLMHTEHKSIITQLGIAHLFAISGLHIGLLFMFSFLVFYNVCKVTLPVAYLGWFSWRLANLFGLVICLMYAYISGFSLPTQRALLMLLLSIVMLSSKRKIALFDLLFFCFWLMLVFDPLAILSSSLWLSYTAMSGIVIFLWVMKGKQTPLEEALSWWQSLSQSSLSVVKNLLLLQLMLTIFMLPIQLINFSAFNPLSLLINLIAIPFFSWLVIPVVLLGALLTLMIEPSSYQVLLAANYLLDMFFVYAQPLVNGYQTLSYHIVALILTCLLFIAVLLLTYLYRHIVNISVVLKGTLMSLLLLFFCIRWFELNHHKQSTWQVEVFDVGQGLAILIRSEGQSLLYDTGPSYGEHYAVANSTILPYLRAKGIDTLTYLIVSHSDNDHAGGARFIQRALSIKHAFAGEANMLNQQHGEEVITKYQQCLTGQNLSLGKLTMSVLSPMKVGKDNNDNSCVIKVSDGRSSVLLTGDISQKIERNLVKQPMQEPSNTLNADILIAPHHGSKTSSSMEFIKQVNPNWVVFSAGYKNRWRFPIKSVVQRYQQQGVEHLTTAKTGFIRFNVENQRIEVKTYREDLAAYWYHQHLAF